MKSVSFASLNRRRRQAMALILVIITVALLSMLIVAIFSVTRTEFKATQSYVASKTAKQMGDAAVAIVEAQIQNAQNTDSSAARTTHATQPGMARVYNPNGSFLAAYKLYSSSTMKVTGDESSLYTDAHVAPANWHTLPARYVDLNEPVVRPAMSTTAATSASAYAVYFPVIDPRAAWNYGSGGQSAGAEGIPNTTQVEGFSYTKQAPSLGSGGGQDYSTKVITPTDASTPDKLRLPMPVEWLYVLEDGTVGALDPNNKFIAAPSSGSGSGGSSGVPSATNPIVGRVAFWTDDESCKININTASEPTFTSTPFYFHQRDQRWAHFPPVTGEYQRYPGHPATVALSSVLAPNYLLDPLLPAADGLSDYMEVVSIKEKIYEFAPKIAAGGSEAGTRPFTQDALSPQNGEREASKKINLDDALKERLYASVDEMLFKDLDYNTSTGRSAAVLNVSSAGNFFAHDRLEHSRFFLTAHSRSPEFSIHGLPRICMWPVADENKGPQWRTSFDNAIALCATIKKNASSSDTTSRSYFFRRSQSRNNTDVSISRNQQLLDYLAAEMSNLTFPSTSYSSSSQRATFQDKYGSDNVNQLAIQFFDYIRCTNLYDGILARKNDAYSALGQSGSQLYLTRDSMASSCYTFTSQRISEAPNTINNSTAEQGIDYRRSGARGMLPGHGQVSPAIWLKGGRSYKGFGRMFTISEIGFQFMCTGDGYAVGNEQLPEGKKTLSADLSSVWFCPPNSAGSGGGAVRRYSTGPDLNHPTNADAYGGRTVPSLGDNDVPADGLSDACWWSNFPPLITADDVANALDVYGCYPEFPEYHPYLHPGFDPKNWNMTLPQGVFLQPNQKRIQVMLMMEAFCPSLGWTGMYPEYTIVLDGSAIAQMKVNGQALFNTTGDIAIKSNGNVFEAQDCHASGGHATPSAFSGGRRVRGVAQGGGIVMLPDDTGYDNSNQSGHQGLTNYAFVSDFVTVDRDTKMQVTFPGDPIRIRIYDTHDYNDARPVQEMYVSFANVPSSQVPVPNLPQSRPWVYTTNQTTGRVTYTRSQQGPHFWSASYNGCVGIMDGQLRSDYQRGDPDPWGNQPPVAVGPGGGNPGQALRGRLDTGAALAAGAPPDSIATGLSVICPEDVTRTLVPAVGDYRTLAAMHDVPASWWKPHPLWQQGMEDIKLVHSFTGYSTTAEPGAKIAVNGSSTMETASYDAIYDPAMQLVGGARFNLDAKGNGYKSLHPRNADLPPSSDYASAANAFGDFDTGVSTAHEGPYINKPDEGNYFAAEQSLGSQKKFWRSSYFYESYENADDWRSGIYMTPNRLIASPVMFGSLPTGVWGNPGGLPIATERGFLGYLGYAPWQTLLFRPHAQISSQQPSSNASHPGLQDPSDHYLLDLFFMPVVEPYAISEPLSIAGRINMNYQIMPFINIRRATGMHALMKGEYITAIPNSQIVLSKEYYAGGTGSGLAWDQRFSNDAQDKRYWHRPVDVNATLRQFDLKFGHRSGGNQNYQGLFRSASQICEMHLIPKIMPGGADIVNPADMSAASSQDVINQTMNAFWGANRPTGDNVRERPYSNLYARLTTRSNTFRVHVRAQIVRKARSTAADTFDADRDAVNGEYRGSYLIERFIDPNDPNVTIPDYAASGGLTGKDPLDTFYRFRTLESKRFNP